MSEGTITFPAPSDGPIKWKAYALFTPDGVMVRELSQDEAEALAKEHPEVDKLLRNAP